MKKSKFRQSIMILISIMVYLMVATQVYGAEPYTIRSTDLGFNGSILVNDDIEVGEAAYVECVAVYEEGKEIDEEVRKRYLEVKEIYEEGKKIYEGGKGISEEEWKRISGEWKKISEEWTKISEEGEKMSQRILRNDLDGKFKYQWYRGYSEDDREKIAGATNSTYTARLEDRGKFIYLEVTPKTNSYKGSYITAGVFVGGERIKDVRVEPVASTEGSKKEDASDVKVGDVYSITSIGTQKMRAMGIEAVSGSLEEKFNFQWYRVKRYRDKKGTDAYKTEYIPGETGTSYTITNEDKSYNNESYLSVRVTSKTNSYVYNTVVKRVHKLTEG